MVYLNLVELYLKVIDNYEASNILKFFGENTTSNDLNFKKMKIRGLLKSNNIRAKRGKKGNQNDRFNDMLQRHLITTFKKLNEKEFFYLMNDPRTQKMPDYKKIANAILLFPHKVEELISAFEFNLENKKSLFDLGYNFDTEEEFNEYIFKTAVYSDNDYLHEKASKLEAYINPDDLKSVNIDKTKLNNITLQELYNMVNSKEYADKSYILLTKYLAAKPKIDLKIKHIILMDILSELVEIKNKELNKAIKEIEQLKEGINNCNVEKTNEYKQKISEFNKILFEREEQIKNYKNVLNELTKQQEVYINNIQNLEENLIKVRKVHENEINALKNNIKLVTEDKEQVEMKLKQIENYWEYFSDKSITGKKHMVVIHALDNLYAAKLIYPEVQFTLITRWQTELTGDIMNEIKLIYIMKSGISTKHILAIQKFGQKNGIPVKVGYKPNEKALIEDIAIIKKEVLEVENHEHVIYT